MSLNAKSDGCPDLLTYLPLIYQSFLDRGVFILTPIILDFVARLVALVPKPRVNLTRFHGVFAPNVSVAQG